MRLLTISAISLGILLIFTDDGFAQARKKSRGKKLYGQRPPRGQQGGGFLDQQWWIGLRGGVNLTEAVPDTRFSAFSGINADSEPADKSYSSFNEPGVWAGLEVTYFWRFISISLQPNFRNQRFSYTNSYEWTQDETTNSLTLNYNQEQDLNYLEIPLLIKWEFMDANWKPFVQFGAYYARLLDATKSVEVTGIDQASGGTSNFEQENFSIGANELFINSSWGLVGGLGVNHDIGNIRLTFDITYRYGINNITDVSNRFSDNRLAGVGDALDDLTLRNIAASFGVLFPMRFLSKSFSAVD